MNYVMLNDGVVSTSSVNPGDSVPPAEAGYAWDFSAAAWIAMPEYATNFVRDIATRAAADSVRDKRDALLRDADVLVYKAQDQGKPTAALAEYRQALRDLPSQTGFPENVEWPAVPVDEQ